MSIHESLIDAHDRLPTGGVHEVGVGQLFFSTTNRLGIIEQSNSVFSQVSRFPREELMGRPHNLIRHPDMPQGAFRLMWDTLQSGQPFCAYVKNLAKDGSDYTVFATVTPLGEGYLSVRSRPCREDLLQACLGIYGAVRPDEIALRRQGVASRTSALVGAEKLLEGVQGAGFPTFEEFVWTVLPAEVKQRHELSGEPEMHPCEGPLLELQTSAAAAHRLLGAWLTRLDELQALIDGLGTEIPRLKAATTENSATATEVSQLLGGRTGLAPIMLSVNLWATMTSDILELLDDLLGDLEALRMSSAKTRFRIALASLHVDAVRQFIEELIVDAPNTLDARPAIIDLTRALREGIAETEQQMASNANLAKVVVERIEAAHGLLLMPHGLIANWQQMVAGRRDSAVLDMLPTIETQISRSSETIGGLARVAESCRTVAQPMDATEVIALCERMSDNAHILTETVPPSVPPVAPVPSPTDEWADYPTSQATPVRSGPAGPSPLSDPSGSGAPGSGAGSNGEGPSNGWRLRGAQPRRAL